MCGTVVRVVGVALADMVQGEGVAKATPSGMAVPRGRKRALRIDPIVRQVAVADVVSSKRARNAPSAARAGIVQVSPRTTAKMPQSFMADYYWTSYRTTISLTQSYVSMDSSGLSGEDTMNLAWCRARSSGARVLGLSVLSFVLCCIVFLCICIVWQCSPVGVRKCDIVVIFGCTV